MLELLQELFEYSAWANTKVFELCDGLTDTQLDQSREMGFGSLRATLFHILMAEEIWLERWQGKPWRTFQTDPMGESIVSIASRLDQIETQRSDFFSAEDSDELNRIISFSDSRQVAFQLPLAALALHVFNHGTHHRSQALNYLRHSDRSAGAGIDYIFYAIGQHAAEMSAEAKEFLSARMPVSDSNEFTLPWNKEAMQLWYRYHDWANDKILIAASKLDTSSLDQPVEMAFGTFRKTLLHTFDVDRWMYNRWIDGPIAFGQKSPDMDIAQLREEWGRLAEARNAFIATVDATRAQSLVQLSFGGPTFAIRLGESLIQVANHSTHHRAQLVNMLRHCQSPTGNIDLLYALPEIC